MEIRIQPRKSGVSTWLVYKAVENARTHRRTFHYVLYPSCIQRDAVFKKMKGFLDENGVVTDRKDMHRLRLDNDSEIWFYSTEYYFYNVEKYSTVKRKYLYIDNIDRFSEHSMCGYYNTQSTRDGLHFFENVADMYAGGTMDCKESFIATVDFRQFVMELDMNLFVGKMMDEMFDFIQDMLKNKDEFISLVGHDVKCNCCMRNRKCLRLGKYFACREGCPRYSDFLVISLNTERK